MSEFSKFLLVASSSDQIATLLAAWKKSACVLPNHSPWHVVVGPQSEKLHSLAFPLALAYEYAADHGFYLQLFLDGKSRAKLKVESEVGHVWSFKPLPWIEAGLLTKSDAEAIETLLKSNRWQHTAVRNQVAAVLRFEVESWLSWEYVLNEGVDTLLERHPTAVHFRKGVRQEIDAHQSVLEDVERILRAEENAPRKVEPVKRPVEPLISNSEARALAAMARNAPPLGGAKVELVPHVDLACCSTAREWLDLKRQVDPAKASAELVTELERTIREGRFPETPDMATVVREGAAMLLGRWLKTQSVDRAAWVESRKSNARSSDENEAWDIIARMVDVVGSGTKT